MLRVPQGGNLLNYKEWNNATSHGPERALRWRKKTQWYARSPASVGDVRLFPAVAGEQVPSFQRALDYNETTLSSFFRSVRGMLAKGFMPTQASSRERVAPPRTRRSSLCYKESFNKKALEGCS